MSKNAFIARKKIFIEKRTVKVAVALFVCTTLAVGALGVFYSTQQTIKYSSDFDSNRALIKAAKAFDTEEDYRRTLSRPDLVAKRTLLTTAYAVAQEQNLLEQEGLTEAQVRSYLAAIDSPTKPSSDSPTTIPEQTYDRYILELQNMLVRFLSFSESLNSEDDNLFRLKSMILTQVGKISNSFDCQGTASGNIARVSSCTNILNSVKNFRKSSAPNEKKEAIVNWCIKELTVNYDFPLLLQTEHLRIMEYLHDQEGIPLGPPRYLVFRPKKPMTSLVKMELRLPGVKSAWISRLNNEFAIGIEKLKDPHDPSLSNSARLGSLGQKEVADEASTEYFRYFGVTFRALSGKFIDCDRLLFHLERPINWRPPGASPKELKRYRDW